MIYETERLMLRRFAEKDLLDLFEYLSDPEVVRFEPYRPMSLEEVRNELDRRILSEEMIAVALKSSGKLIGNVYLGKRDNNTLELGFVFNKDYWNQSLPKTAIQFIRLWYRPANDFNMDEFINNNGHPHYGQLLMNELPLKELGSLIQD